MLNFKPITVADRSSIEGYTATAALQNCDLAFANMVCWQGVYHSEWCELDGFLVIRFRIEGGHEIGYMQPVGEGAFTHLIPALEADARSLGQPLRLVGLTDEGWQAVDRAYLDCFAAEADRKWFDYIYRREDLEQLRGKHYQPKRNHLNRFRSTYPNHRYERLTARHAAACMALSNEWCRHHGGCADAALQAEQEAMQFAFGHFEELGLQGGVLYVEEQLVAFSYGSIVGGTTFVVHAEKADTRYEGVFATINHALIEQLDPAIRWINREEDLGIEGLRKAKLSYCPALLLQKWKAVAQDRSAQACRSLWMRAFPNEERTFVDQFLLRYYHPTRMLIRERADRMVAMAHLLPFDCDGVRIGYLFGVATDPAWRGQGLASELVEEAIAWAGHAGYKAVVLIPGEAALRNFYARLGFGGDIPIRLLAADHFDFGTGSSETDRAMIRYVEGQPVGALEAPTLTAHYVET